MESVLKEILKLIIFAILIVQTVKLTDIIWKLWNLKFLISINCSIRAYNLRDQKSRNILKILEFIHKIKKKKLKEIISMLNIVPPRTFAVMVVVSLGRDVASFSGSW